MQVTRPGESLNLRDSRLLCQEQDGYFLFFMLRIATISSATVKITMNSSYVLIIITSSVRMLGTGESTSPGCPGKQIILQGF